MTVITPPGLIPGGQTITREIPGVGVLRFEDYAAGQWLTQKGEPAKKARRRYLLDDVELDGVSSIVGTLSKEALQIWIETQATIGAVQAERMGELAGVPQEDWCKRVKFLGLGASAKRDEGADRGTVIHQALHTLAVEGRAPNPSEFPGVARPWLQGAVAAWLALNPSEVVCAEEIVCHPEHRYAGRPDAVVVADGKRCLLDWKSSRGGKAWPESHWQTRLYAMALERLGIPVDRILVVGIGDDGGFELTECAASESDVVALISVFRARKRIASDMAAQRSIAKAAAA